MSYVHTGTAWIWELYQTDPGYRAGQKQVPYEFYELLDMIKDPKEKETIARAAYTSVKDEDGLRQWPLAAYELARCYAQRGVADTNLLKPYIDVQLNLEYHKQKMDDFGNASWQGWYNDEAIVKIKNNVEKMKATAVGQKFTDFEMQTPEGKTVKLSDYVGKGKVVLVDFWASWCGPCRREMPNLVEAYAKYKNKNFEIVGVSLDQSADAWKEAIKKLNITWPQMSDLKYWNCEGAQLYAVSSIPHTVLIDGEGTILARGLHGDELQEKIAEAVK